VKPYPKDNEPRTFGVDDGWLAKVALHIQSRGLDRDQLLFTTTAGTPISRNTFRTRVWLPAVAASGIGFNVRMHDLRHAHASWIQMGRIAFDASFDRSGNRFALWGLAFRSAAAAV